MLNTCLMKNAKAKSHHTPQPVPALFYCNQPITRTQGGLIDIAPTVLDMLGITAPSQMSGQSSKKTIE